MEPCNYNIEVDILKLRGAKIADVRGNRETRRCVCIPIDDVAGTVVCASGEESCLLKLTAFALRVPVDGKTHRLKPAFGKETLDRMTDEQIRQVPFVGTMRQWSRGERVPDGYKNEDNW